MAAQGRRQQLTDKHHGGVFSLIQSRPTPVPGVCARRSQRMTCPSMDAVRRISGDSAPLIFASINGGAFLGGAMARAAGAGAAVLGAPNCGAGAGAGVSVSGSSSNKGSKDASDLASESMGWLIFICEFDPELALLSTRVALEAWDESPGSGSRTGSVYIVRTAIAASCAP